MYLVFSFAGNLFIVAYIYIFLIMRIWISCSDRPFIMGVVEYKFMLLLSTNILLVAGLELFWTLVTNFTVCDRLYVVNHEGSCFFQLLSMRWSLFISPQIKSSTFKFIHTFQSIIWFFINWLKSPVGTLYKLNIINVDYLVSTSTAQISKSFYLQLCEILILLKYKTLQTKIHAPPFCRFFAVEMWS